MIVLERERLQNNCIIYLGGPLVTYDADARRFVLLGNSQASFADCTNIVPNIFVATDDISTLQFLRREVYGKGWFFEH